MRMMKTYEYHNPVMLSECLSGLKINPDGFYVDGTFGGGGHSQAILKGLSDKGILWGFDQDPATQNKVIKDDRFRLVLSNFAYLEQFFLAEGKQEFDGLLLDLGISSRHIDDADRGFSFQKEALLDMRMNTRGGLAASEWLKKVSEKELSSCLRKYGEIVSAGKLAQAILTRGTAIKKWTTSDLNQVVIQTLNPAPNRTNRLLAMVYQAIRIEINQEMEVLEQVLQTASKYLKIGGRLVVMSYHSLEDNIVKRHIKQTRLKETKLASIYGQPPLLYKSLGKVITPSEKELKENRRARSAKLRIAEKIK